MTDSVSEALAATPKAVKSVSDEIVKLKESLGTASKANVVTSLIDSTSGRLLLLVGWDWEGLEIPGSQKRIFIILA